MVKKIVFILAILLLNVWGQSARALELSFVCGFKKDQFTKFSTNLGTQANQNFGTYSSGLDIIRNGAKLDGWQPVWCYGRPLTDEKSVRKDGYFNFKITGVSDLSGLVLKNTSGDTTIPIKVCMGKNGGTLGEYCAEGVGEKFITIPMNSPDSVEKFNNSVMPVSDNWKNPSWDLPLTRYNWRVASHIEIPPQTNAPPGIYSGKVNIALAVRSRGTMIDGTGINPDVDGESVFSTTFEVFIHKDCKFQTPNPINFGTANFVSDLATASGQLTVQCTKNTPYSIKMSGKNDLNGDHDNHYMINKKGESIPYQLYNADGTTLWQYNNPVKFNGTGNAESIGILAKVSSGASEVSAGKYSDTITAELIY